MARQVIIDEKGNNSDYKNTSKTGSNPYKPTVAKTPAQRAAESKAAARNNLIKQEIAQRAAALKANQKPIVSNTKYTSPAGVNNNNINNGITDVPAKAAITTGTKSNVTSNVTSNITGNTTSNVPSGKSNVITSANNTADLGTSVGATSDAGSLGTVISEKLAEITNSEEGATITSDDGEQIDARAAAIDGYVQALQAQNEANYQAEVARINAATEMSVLEQEEAKKQAQIDHAENLDSINQQTFDNTQAGKLSAGRRGIANSQQAEGMQQGYQREAMGLRFKNDQDRTQRISTLTDRIAAIRSGAQSQISAAGSVKNASDSAAIAKGYEREFQVEDREDVQDFQSTEREAGQDFVADENLKKFEQTVYLTDKTFENDLAKMDAGFKYTMLQAAQENEWNMDRDAVNNMAALDRLNVSHAQAKEIMGMQQTYGMTMDIFNHNQQKEIIKLDYANMVDFAQLDESRQIRIMDAAKSNDKEMTNFQIATNYKMAQVDEFYKVNTKEDVLDLAMSNVNDENRQYKKTFWGMIGYSQSTLAALTDTEFNKLIAKNEKEANDIIDIMYDPNFMSDSDKYTEVKTSNPKIVKNLLDGK